MFYFFSIQLKNKYHISLVPKKFEGKCNGKKTKRKNEMNENKNKFKANELFLHTT